MGAIVAVGRRAGQAACAAEESGARGRLAGWPAGDATGVTAARLASGVIPGRGGAA